MDHLIDLGLRLSFQLGVIFFDDSVLGQIEANCCHLAREIFSARDLETQVAWDVCANLVCVISDLGSRIARNLIGAALWNNKLPSFGEELDEIQWSEQDEVELEKVEDVLLDGAVFEDLELVLAPSLDLIDDLSRVHSGDLSEFGG